MSELGDRKGRIKMAALLVTLLQGPVDTGISLVTNDTITAMMLEMAANDKDTLQQVFNISILNLMYLKNSVL